jgi:hypothetical protein
MAKDNISRKRRRIMTSFTKKTRWPTQATNKIRKTCGAETARTPHLGELIQVGGILTQQRKRLGATKWQQWIDEALPFSRSTAQRYMQLYRAFLMGQQSGKGF